MSELGRQIALEEDLLVAEDLLLTQGFGPLEDVANPVTGWVEGMQVFRGPEHVGSIWGRSPFFVRGLRGLEEFYAETDDALEAARVLIGAVEEGRIWPRVVWNEMLSRAEANALVQEKGYLDLPGRFDSEWGRDRIRGVGFDGLLVDGVAPIYTEVQVAAATLEWTWLKDRYGVRDNRDTVMTFSTRQESNASGVLMLELEGRARVLNALGRAMVEHPQEWAKVLRAYQQKDTELPAKALEPFVRKYVDLELEIPTREAMFKAVMRTRPKSETLPAFKLTTIVMAIQGLPEVAPSRKLKNRLLS